jgi:hypothetical protein
MEVQGALSGRGGVFAGSSDHNGQWRHLVAPLMHRPTRKLVLTWVTLDYFELCTTTTSSCFLCHQTQYQPVASADAHRGRIRGWPATVAGLAATRLPAYPGCPPILLNALSFVWPPASHKAEPRRIPITSLALICIHDNAGLPQLYPHRAKA